MGEHRLVLVEWDDSAQPVPSWAWLEDHSWESVVKCRSVGWLVFDGEEVKALAPNKGNLGEDEALQVSGVIRIPTRCITRLVDLGEVRESSFSPCARPGRVPSPQDS